jgi:hypothetical protein
MGQTVDPALFPLFTRDVVPMILDASAEVDEFESEAHAFAM